MILAYLLLCEMEVSSLTPVTTRQRHRRAAQSRGALGQGTKDDPGQLRLRAIRRPEPDVGKLVEWVLNITQTRYDAYRDGQPDPYDLPIPANLSLMSDARGRVEEEPAQQRRSTA